MGEIFSIPLVSNITKFDETRGYLDLFPPHHRHHCFDKANNLSSRTTRLKIFKTHGKLVLKISNFKSEKF